MKKDKNIHPLLKVENIYLKFGSRDILKDVNFVLEPSTITVITGKSGSGKTTLLGIISGLLRPNKGRVLYKGKNILRWGDIRRSFFRNKRIGFVFQFFNLLNDYTAFQNIILPTMFNPFARNASTKAKELISFLNLTNISSQHPETLSGGERQRIAIARAIINNPDIILADEPTGNLDDDSAADIKDLFVKLKNENKIAFIIVTHDHRIVDASDFHYHLVGTDLQLQPKVGLKKKATTEKNSKKPVSSQAIQKKLVKKSMKKVVKKSVKKSTTRTKK